MITSSNIDIKTEPVPFYTTKGTTVDILRADLVHPVISGNKWFKLRFYIEEALQLGKTTILTFGGAYSNHIIAVAAACHVAGLRSVGVIRGEEPERLSHTLQQTKEYGMQLHFSSRTAYAAKDVSPSLIRSEIYTIPEGGYGAKGAAGAATLLDHIDHAYSHICCAVGTGTMMAGLLNAAKAATVIGISVLKNNYSQEQEVRDLLINRQQAVYLLHDYHFGGYAKHTPALFEFMNRLYAQTGIPSDFVYTGKLFYAVQDLLQKDYFPAGSRLLLVHSGGLQGNDSLPKGTLMF